MPAFFLLRARLIAALAVLALTGLLPDSTQAAGAKFNRVVQLGQEGPDWTGLKGTDDKIHSLKDYREAKAVVVVMTCNHCPYAKAYEERLIKLASENAIRGVQVVAISCSLLEADQLEGMKQRAAEKKYPFDYLHDPAQQVGKRYGALVTPQVFLLNQQRRIAYMGKIDDSPDPDDVTEPFLQNAIDAVLAGREPEVRETKAVGCPIQYE